MALSCRIATTFNKSANDAKYGNLVNRRPGSLQVMYRHVECRLMQLQLPCTTKDSIDKLGDISYKMAKNDVIVVPSPF